MIGDTTLQAASRKTSHFLTAAYLSLQGNNDDDDNNNKELINKETQKTFPLTENSRPAFPKHAPLLC